MECISMPGDFYLFKIKITKGFRHQIRSHLAWIGMPIINDELYGGIHHGKGILALRASSISFNDPASEKKCTYSIPALELGNL